MTTSTDIHRVLETVRFRLVQPEEPTDRLRDFDFALANTIISDESALVALESVFRVRAMSTPANAFVINRLVTLMDPEDCYLNIGTWRGFSFFAGCSVPDRWSIGVDDFSQFGGPREDFMKVYNADFQHARTLFFDMDYRKFFASEMTALKRKVGLYFYDGAHDYTSQYRALEVAEPFLAENALIVVDDTNHAPARQATLTWIAERHPQYVVACDALTAHKGHPTFWNGLLIAQRRPERRLAEPSIRGGEAIERNSPIDEAPPPTGE